MHMEFEAPPGEDPAAAGPRDDGMQRAEDGVEGAHAKAVPNKFEPGRHPAEWKPEEILQWCVATTSGIQSIMERMNATKLAGLIKAVSQDAETALKLTSMLPPQDCRVVVEAATRYNHHAAVYSTMVAQHLQVALLVEDGIIGAEDAAWTSRDLTSVVVDYAYAMMTLTWDLQRHAQTIESKNSAIMAQQQVDLEDSAAHLNMQADVDLASEIQLAYEGDVPPDVNQLCEARRQRVAHNAISKPVSSSTSKTTDVNQNDDGAASATITDDATTNGVVMDERLTEHTAPELEAVAGLIARDEPLSSFSEMSAECLACTEKIPTARLACGHQYCRACITTLVRSAMVDRSLLPARCCKIPVEVALTCEVLDPVAAAAYVARCAELTAKQKMYCEYPSCATFINLDPLVNPEDGSVLLPDIDCPACFRGMCTACKTRSHPDLTCLEWQSREPEAQYVALSNLAKAEGWARCFSCKTFVELRTGCNHITCACKAQFCYVCHQPWRTPRACNCAVWDEARIVQHEDRQVHLQEDLRGRALLPREAAEVRHNVRLNLHDGYECEHDDRFHHEYSRSKSSRHCHNCDHPTPSYAYRCADCNERFCKVCHFHRL